MKKILVFIVICISCNTHSQSIMSYLNFGKKNDFHSTKLVSETTIFRTFYNSKNIEKKKEVTSYNFQNNQTVENRFDENNILKQRLTRVYDSTGTRSIFKKFENWHPIIGHFFENTYYLYDSNGFLNRVIEKNENNTIVRETVLTSDEKGYPIELIIYIGNEMQARETAEYDYEKNDVLIRYFNKENVLVNSVNSKIEFSKNESGDVVNEYGDIIISDQYEKKIKYDKFGNWIKEVYLILKNGKFIKSSETIRVIKYRK